MSYRWARSNENLTHSRNVRPENVEHSRELGVMGKVIIPLEHSRDEIRVAEIQPVPSWGAQHKDITHLLVAFPPQWDLKSQVVVLGDIILTQTKRQSLEQSHDLLAGEAP